MSAVKRARVVRPETKARIVAAIQEWNDVVGRPPGSADWNPASPRHRSTPETEYRSWPWVAGIVGAFGSWNAAIEAAGFEALLPGSRRDPEAWREAQMAARPPRSEHRARRREMICELWADGKTTREIASELECPVGTVSWEVYEMRQDGLDLPRRRPGPQLKP